MKKMKKIITIIVIVFVVLGIVKNPLIKTAVTVGATQVVGAPVHIDSFGVGIFKQAVWIKGFKLYNPAGFPKGVLLDIPEVSVDYRLLDIIKGKLYLPLVVVDVKEMTLIKNKEGLLNVDALKVAKTQEKPASEEKQEKPKKPAKAMPMKIDLAKLTIGRLIYKDYSEAEASFVKVYDVGIKGKEYRNINSAQEFATLILVQGMGPAALKGAAIYAAAALTGVGLIPVAIAGVLIGQDTGIEEFKTSFDKAYETAREVLQNVGKVTTEDKDRGLIKADIKGFGVAVEIIEKEKNKVEIQVSARKLTMPKLEVANGILYQISEKLK